VGGGYGVSEMSRYGQGPRLCLMVKNVSLVLDLELALKAGCMAVRHGHTLAVTGILAIRRTIALKMRKSALSVAIHSTLSVIK
jgi:hypothetical protein